MSKKFIQDAFQDIAKGKYSWTLYFLKINRRYKENPYFLSKHTFKNTTYLQDYMKILCEMIVKNQIEPLESIQKYDGSNSKTSCDKLELNNDLISDQWGQIVSSVTGAPRERIKGKYQGYILDGHPDTEEYPAITIIKTGNPIISLGNKNTKVFKYSSNEELDRMTDELCRLYLSADCFIIDETLYTFNLNFEEIFNLEKTLHKLKDRAVETIMDTKAFDDEDNAKKYFLAYTSPKTFLTLKPQRVSKLNTAEGRKEVADRLGIKLSVSNMIELDNQEKTNRLIKYLCNKIFQDKETDNLMEVNSIINENVLGK